MLAPPGAVGLFMLGRVVEVGSVVAPPGAVGPFIKKTGNAGHWSKSPDFDLLLRQFFNCLWAHVSCMCFRSLAVWDCLKTPIQEVN